MANVIQNIREVKHQQAQLAVDPSLRALDVVNVNFRTGNDLASNKPNQKGSVKGKKALARARASQDSSLVAAEGELCISPCAGQVDKRASRMADVQIPCGGDFNLESNGGPASKITLELQSTNMPRPKMGFKFKGSRNDDSSGGAS